MSTTSDVSARISAIYPRASSVSSTQLTALLDVVRDDIREDLYTTFPESYQGQQIISTTQITPPTATISSVAGNIDNGNYRYKVSFVNTARESAIGEASTVVNVEDKTTAGQMSLTGVIVSGDASTTSRKIYRQQNGSGYYYLVGTIADNTTTTFTDNVDQGTAIANGKALNGQAVADDFYRQLAVMDGSRRVEVRRRSEQSDETTSTILNSSPQRTNKNFVWFDYEDRVSGTSQMTINFDPKNSFGGDLTLVYRKNIADATDGGALPYPTSIHARILNLLSYGVSLYYLAGKTGEDDHVAKLQELYEGAKDIFSGSISQQYG